MRPSILATEAMLPAPKACAGLARSKTTAMVNSRLEVPKNGILKMQYGLVVEFEESFLTAGDQAVFVVGKELRIKQTPPSSFVLFLVGR